MSSSSVSPPRFSPVAPDVGKLIKIKWNMKEDKNDINYSMTWMKARIVDKIESKKSKHGSEYKYHLKFLSKFDDRKEYSHPLFATSRLQDKEFSIIEDDTETKTLEEDSSDRNKKRKFTNPCPSENSKKSETRDNITQTENDIKDVEVTSTTGCLSAIRGKEVFTTPHIYTGGGFKDLVHQSTIFVDKSLFIRDIIKQGTQVILITMPRRWGKSLNLEMLKRFLSIVVDKETGFVILNIRTNNYMYFVGGNIDIDGDEGKMIKTVERLKIADEEDCMEHQGQYPVIFIDFKDCKRSGGFVNVEEDMREIIIRLYVSFTYLGSSNEKYGKEMIKDRYDKLLSDLTGGKRLKFSIRDLSELLFLHHKKQVWILIDEYDAAANEAYRELDHDEANKVAKLFRDILEPALKGNDKYLYRAVLTGVQYLVKSGMLSGLNNLEKYSIRNYDFSRHFGVNQEELNLLLDHFRIDDDRKDKIKDWYNGYHEYDEISGEFISKYNIWSVVEYLNHPKSGFVAYWEESGSIEFIANLFKRKEFLNIMNLLLDGESLSFMLTADFDISDFITLKEIINLDGNEVISPNGFDVLFSYLFITGYLTQDANHNYIIPNEEIKCKLRKKVIKYYRTVYNLDYVILQQLTSILQKIFDGYQSSNSENERFKFIIESFESHFQPTFDKLVKKCHLVSDKQCTEGIFANEDSLHSILNFIGLQVKDIFFGSEIYIKKNCLDSLGRVDIALKNKQTGIIIEVKYNGNALEALAQAQTYEYLISSQDEKVFIGLNISSSKDVSLVGEIRLGSEFKTF